MSVLERGSISHGADPFMNVTEHREAFGKKYVRI